MRSAVDGSALNLLRRRTAAIWEERSGRGADVALLDVPNQRNAGDSLILLGELAYLRDIGARVRYFADAESYEPKALCSAMPSGVVLMHGGGNFGDIWIGHQAHRERVSRQLADYKIVVLPQSVYHDSPERAAVSDRVLGSHPDHTVMVRDMAPLERLRHALPSVRNIYSPDAAFGWRPQGRVRSSAEGRVLVLARDDRESSSQLAESARRWHDVTGATVADWAPDAKLQPRWDDARRAMGLLHDTVSASRRAPQRQVRCALMTINGVNVRSGHKLVSGRRGLVVDRLCAHILATVLGIYHFVLDHGYGKVRAVYDEYSGEFSNSCFASNPGEASSLMRREAV